MDSMKKDGLRATKLFNFRPVFFAAIFLCLGIAFAFYHLLKGVSSLWLLGLLPAATLPFCFCRTQAQLKATAWAVVLLGISFFVGFFSFWGKLAQFSSADNLSGDGYAVGYVCEKRAHGSWTGIVLEDVVIGEERIESGLIAYLPASFAEDVRLCDKILVRGNIRTRKLDGDNFLRYIQDFGNNICYETWTSEGVIVGEKFDLFMAIRNRMDEVISVGMDRTPAAVTKAVLLGDTSGIDAQLYDNVRMGGIAHIFAVSGLHVGALFAFCLLLLKPFKRLPNVARLCVVTSVLACYAGICGYSASVLRAAVLCIVGYGAKLLRIKSDPLEGIGIAAIFILLLTPSALFEVGFQLSFLACLGIMLFAKPMGQVCDEIIIRLQKVGAKDREEAPPMGLTERALHAVGTVLSTSLAAQTLTTPVLLYYFGYVSVWGLLLNCIFVPLISAVFGILLFGVLLACVLPTAFAFVILYLPNIIWSALLLVFQTMDFSSFAIRDLCITATAMIPYLFAWLFLSDKWNLRRFFRYILAGVCICAFVITMVALNV